MSRVYTYSEQVLPLLFGLCTAGLYYRLNKPKLEGAVLKAHTLGLTVSAFTKSGRAKNNKIHFTLSLSPLLITLCVLAQKKNRINPYRYLAFGVGQAGGAHLIALVILLKKEFFFHHNIHDYYDQTPDVVTESLRRKEQSLNHFAFAVDQEKARELLDEFKLVVCNHFSQRPECVESAEQIGKTISDLTRKLSALKWLAQYVPDKGEALYVHCQNLGVYPLDALEPFMQSAKKAIEENYDRDLNTLRIKDAEAIEQELIHKENRVSQYAIPELQESSTRRLNDYKLEVCRIFSISYLLIETAEKIGKSISNPSKQLSALKIVAVNAPHKARALLTHCQTLENLPPEALEPLKFEAEKAKVKLEDAFQVIIPPPQCDPSKTPRKTWERIQQVFEDVMASPCNVICRKTGTQHELVVTRDGQQTIHSMPVKCQRTEEGSYPNYILSLKYTIGKGGEREVKLYYSLTKGEFYAKKFIPSGLETVLLRTINESNKPGLPKVTLVTDKGEGTDILQPYFDCDLSKAISDSFLNTRQAKLFVIEQVFLAILNFQANTLSGLTYGFDKKPIDPTPVFHGDIKPANFVFNKDTLEVMLIDLGVACHVTSIDGTLFYLDPQSAELLKEEPFDWAGQENGKIESFIDHNLSYGQKRDVWGAALVASAVLFGINDNIPEINALQNCKFIRRQMIGSYCVSPRYSDTQLVIRNIAKLEQYQIDDSLNTFAKKEPLVPLLKKMLTIDPKKRITVQEALKELRGLIY